MNVADGVGVGVFVAVAVGVGVFVGVGVGGQIHGVNDAVAVAVAVGVGVSVAVAVGVKVAVAVGVGAHGVNDGVAVAVGVGVGVFVEVDVGVEVGVGNVQPGRACAAPMSGKPTVPVFVPSVSVNAPRPAPCAAARLILKSPVAGAFHGVTLDAYVIAPMASNEPSVSLLPLA